ncbi:MAG: hypothetical protein ABIA04_13580 [Pseudomonadota bacterium]
MIKSIFISIILGCLVLSFNLFASSQGKPCNVPDGDFFENYPGTENKIGMLESFFRDRDTLEMYRTNRECFDRYVEKIEGQVKIMNDKSDRTIQAVCDRKQWYINEKVLSELGFCNGEGCTASIAQVESALQDKPALNAEFDSRRAVCDRIETMASRIDKVADALIDPYNIFDVRIDESEVTAIAAVACTECEAKKSTIGAVKEELLGDLPLATQADAE